MLSIAKPLHVFSVEIISSSMAFWVFKAPVRLDTKIIVTFLEVIRKHYVNDC
jgi:hypothetical protein